MTSLDFRPGERILVSACLLGLCCRFDGNGAADERVLSLAGRHCVIPVCPEQLGGLPTPRPAVELRAGRALTRYGQDVTDNFVAGADQVGRIAELTGARVAVLQPRSPSCGIGVVYDGTFSGTRISGYGILAERLRARGFLLLVPADLERLRF